MGTRRADSMEARREEARREECARCPMSFRGDRSPTWRVLTKEIMVSYANLRIRERSRYRAVVPVQLELVPCRSTGHVRARLGRLGSACVGEPRDSLESPVICRGSWVRRGSCE